ncbi:MULTISPECIES: D-alanyl-D-alanine carboxypeptidase family protein [Microbacterium]|uniref:D-alanyl-D-alanine carboxypeptidase (Penicillin-binding protein 5/6) n=1 Tax=Microbacterium saccharophilum TaxID=1213358 RepID=A0A7Z7GF44_9MICO|nr:MULTISPECIES: D-alanyl-D-alanine carboxypeptidase [Microbacterium]SFI48713.1 D-alanyl-D-alanine carboxypeptidase (penicillin-binding protein 5/6) [Microbacterium saccharophilum]
MTRPPAPPQRRALEWVDERALAAAPPRMDLRTATAPYAMVSPDLLERRPRRSPFRPGVLVPIGGMLLLVAAYVATTLLWPLHAVPPVITASQISAVSAPLSAPAWPEEGAAAVSVDGIAGTVSSTADPAMMASITKLVTALLVLDQQPLTVGEPGPEYAFTARDRATYREFLSRGESALDVPVGGTLTQYQLLQGMLIGSGGNYAERLARTFWPSDAVFARAARDWLAQHGLSGITVVEPTGIDEGNLAAPAAVLALADRALANPVIAEIVDTESVTLPGAGEVENTNDLLADPAVTGVKTGGLEEYYNLVAAREVVVGETTVRVYATALGQPSDAERDEETARLLEAVSAEVAQPAVLPAGTVAGVVTTPWGARAEVVTDEAGAVVLWNGAFAVAEPAFELDAARAADDSVGRLSFEGPLDRDTVGLRLAGDIEPPSRWWRLTHPLELFGLVD